MKNRISVLRVLSCIAVLVLALVMVVGTTFSWYDRTKGEDKTAYKIEYSQSGKVTAVGCTFETFLGTNTDGVVEYSETASTGTITLGADEEKSKLTYFKTVITNDANAGDAIVSLNLKDAPVSNALHVGIIEPEKTYKPFTGIDSTTNASVVCIEDNIELANNGEQPIYWFIEVPAGYSSDLTINLDNLYVVYK